MQIGLLMQLFAHMLKFLFKLCILLKMLLKLLCAAPGKAPKKAFLLKNKRSQDQIGFQLVFFSVVRKKVFSDFSVD